MQKTILCLLLVSLMTLGFTACTQQPVDQTPMNVDQTTSPDKNNTNNQDNVPDVALEQTIKDILAQKYGRDSASFQFKVNLQTANHLRGDVTFFDNNGQPAAGALVLAAKVNNQWQIVFDGNGQIDCGLLEPYDFPADMKYDCVSRDDPDSQPGGQSACTDECGNGICEEIVCMAVGCPCPETSESCPADCQ